MQYTYRAYSLKAEINMTQNPQTENTGWKANLSLEFKATALRTVISKREHKGPLAIQRPFYPEDDVCHVYLLHPPGGVVGHCH